MFRRETSAGALIPAVDGLRFVAIGSVVLYHVAGYVLAKRHAIAWHDEVPPAAALDPVLRLAYVGFFGVQLFFVISGFILGLPFAKARLSPGAAPVPLRAYFLRRLTRLEPPYVLNLLALAAMLVLFRGQNVTDVAPHLLSSVGYVHNLVYGEASHINGAAWSLEIEVQFYVLAPLLGAIYTLPTVPRRLVFVAAILLLSAAQGFTTTPLWGGILLVHQLHYFLVGMLLADLRLTRWATAPLDSRWDAAGALGWITLLVVLLVGVSPEHHGPTHWVQPVACAAILLCYSAALRGPRWAALFSSPWLYLIGGMCYTLYLWHVLVISTGGAALARVVPPGLPIGAEILLFAALLSVPLTAVGAVLFLLIEKPCMSKDWPTRLRRWVGARLSRHASV